MWIAPLLLLLPDSLRPFNSYRRNPSQSWLQSKGNTMSRKLIMLLKNDNLWSNLNLRIESEQYSMQLPKTENQSNSMAFRTVTQFKPLKPETQSRLITDSQRLSKECPTGNLEFTKDCSKVTLKRFCLMQTCLSLVAAKNIPLQNECQS
jgi:hypothetical protein